MTKMQSKFIPSLYNFSIMDRKFVYNIQTTECVEIENDESKAQQTRKLETLLGKKQIPYIHFFKNSLLAVSLHVSHRCNLSCDYCYANRGSYGRETDYMSHEMMVKSIDFAFKHSKVNHSLGIGFFGGEPLLNFKLIKDCVQLAKQTANQLNKKVKFFMTSNATLLKPVIMEFISRKKFSLLFSFDGPKEIHDKVRKFQDGKGSYSIVQKNLKYFQNHYHNNFAIRSTFTKDTLNFHEQVVFLNDQGFKNISVEPAQLDNKHPFAITTDFDIEQVRQEYNKLAKIYLKRFDQKHPLHFFHFDDVLKRLLNPNPRYTECGSGGSLIAITPEGYIFPCSQSVLEEDNCIGHLDYGFYQEKRNRFQRIYVDLKEECCKCWMKYFCGGGCHALNIRYNHNINIPYKPYCEFIKHRFKLGAWLLAEIRSRGNGAVNELKSHLQIE